MTQDEPIWMRETRLRGEEARMVQLESNVAAIRQQADAIRELFEEERRQRRKAEERLEEHEQSDNTKFASIDSRLQGTQTQLTTIITTLERLERTVKTGDAEHETRLKALEADASGRTAVARWLRSAWVLIGIGASIGGSLVGAYTVLVP